MNKNDQENLKEILRKLAWPLEGYIIDEELKTKIKEKINNLFSKDNDLKITDEDKKSMQKGFTEYKKQIRNELLDELIDWHKKEMFILNAYENFEYVMRAHSVSIKKLKELKNE